MGLAFKILWFEDQFEELASLLQELGRILDDEYGIAFDYEDYPSINGLEEVRKRQNAHLEFDLVVVDYNLKGEEKGDSVVRKVRQAFPFVDIIFYSGLRPEELREKIYAQGVDGVFSVNRNNLSAGLLGRIEGAMARRGGIDEARGTAAATVGEIDELLREIVQRQTADGGAMEVALSAKLAALVKESTESQAANFECLSNLSLRLTSLSVTSLHLARLAKRSIADLDDAAHQRDVLGSYNEEVLKLRNLLSHATHKKTDDGWYVENERGDRFSKAELPELRRSLRRHLENARDIRDTLRGVADKPS